MLERWLIDCSWRMRRNNFPARHWGKAAVFHYIRNHFFTLTKWFWFIKGVASSAVVFLVKYRAIIFTFQNFQDVFSLVACREPLSLNKGWRASGPNFESQKSDQTESTRPRIRTACQPLHSRLGSEGKFECERPSLFDKLAAAKPFQAVNCGARISQQLISVFLFTGIS